MIKIFFHFVCFCNAHIFIERSTKLKKATQHVAKMYKNDGIVRRYSEGFKLKILAELSTGNYSKKQLGEIYGINRTTINEWIKKYNRKDLMNTRILVETQDETTRIKALQKEIKQLKELLIKKDLDKLVMDSYLEVVATNCSVYFRNMNCW